MSSSAANTHLRALLGTLRFSIQPVAMSVTVSVQAPVDSGRRHAGQQRRGVPVDVQLAEPTQDRHQLAQDRRPPLARRHTQHCPAEDQRRNNFRPAPG
jgi:hypothetical protein